MKVIIAGGRDFKSTGQSILLLDSLGNIHKITEVVSGMATGADAFGEHWANNRNIPIKQFAAEWDNLSEPCIVKHVNGKPYNSLAGPNRNRKMAEYADAVILFKGGKGTANMRKYAKALGLKILYDEGNNVRQ